MSTKKFRNGKWVRQGDVPVTAVKGITKVVNETKDRKDHGRIILAYGEVTGHSHQLVAKKSEEIKFFRARLDKSRLNKAQKEILALVPDETEVDILVIPETVTDAQIVHEEHTPHALPPGEYVVIIQREFVRGEVTSVRD